MVSQQQSEDVVTAKEVTSTLDKERKDWTIRQAEMVKHIADLQEECRSVVLETVIAFMK